MKIPGIIGGLSPEATILYYESIIELYRKRVTDDSYPHILIHSINMNRMLTLLKENHRGDLIEYFRIAIEKLYKGDADFGAIASNTPHLIFEELEPISQIPLISIVDVTAEAVEKQRLKKVLLLGTKFTMTNDFYKNRFKNGNISIIVPEEKDQDFIHDIIFLELVFGQVQKESKERLISIIESIKKNNNIEGVILGCTELPLILSDEDKIGLPLFNTTMIHVEAIVDHILQSD